jgi:hypothetical protein
MNAFEEPVHRAFLPEDLTNALTSELKMTEEEEGLS